MKYFVLFLALIAFVFPSFVSAQETQERKGEVIDVEHVSAEQGGYDIVDIEDIESGAMYRIDTSQGYLQDNNRFNVKTGDKVFVQVIESEGAEDIVFLVDVYRGQKIIWIFVFFAVLAVIVGKKRGFSALLGIAVTVAVLFLFLFPALIHGWDALLSTLIASIVILATNMFLSHGYDDSSKAALFGTYGGLFLTIVFAAIFTSFARLSGLGSSDSALLVLESGVIIPKGILLSGIILGAVGVLDDVAITQTEIVSEIHKANPKLPKAELFRRAMHIGRHHIASSVNTLVLAYAGAALPLFLLFMLMDIGWMRFISEEVVAEEVVRTLAGTTALILTVPLATWFATIFQKR
ncbi:YibE/F family protein [Patescibacteria group bacterium]|nr:YibE/F family protein [Patescibacteria group bacterium]